MAKAERYEGSKTSNKICFALYCTMAQVLPEIGNDIHTKDMCH